MNKKILEHLSQQCFRAVPTSRGAAWSASLPYCVPAVTRRHCASLLRSIVTILAFDAAKLACERFARRGHAEFWQNNLHPMGSILLSKTLPAAPIRWLFAAYQKAGDRFCLLLTAKSFSDEQKFERKFITLANSLEYLNEKSLTLHKLNNMINFGSSLD